MFIDKVGYNVYFGKITKNAGGPSGYLYQLKLGLEGAKITDIRVVSYGEHAGEYTTNSNNISRKILRKLIKTFLMNIFPDTYFTIVTSHTESVRMKKCEEVLKEILYSDDSVRFLHFHFVGDIILYDNIKKSIIPTILTSHSPEAFHIEITHDTEAILRQRVIFDKTRKFLLSKYFRYWKQIDEKAFTIANYLMFPCEEAMEPYLETWPEFQKIIKAKTVFFVPTGVSPLEYNLQRDHVREKYGIPKDAFVVSYVGRHNLVKGYDLLCKAAEMVWKKNPNVYFLIAGKEFPLKGLKDKRWIEVGWTNTPGNIVSASDVFVLPNRRTFFDLVLLEVMSIGKPVIVSFTGGNKFVAKQTSGVITFERENVSELAKRILDFSILKQEEIEKFGLENRILYENFYTPEKFARRYREEVGKIFFGEN